MSKITLEARGQTLELDARPDPQKTKGEAAAVILCDPQFAHNLGGAIRACSCWGFTQLWWTGETFKIKKGQRLPREERMKGYNEVAVYHHDKPLDFFSGCTPVAVELRRNSEKLHHFERPDNAVYIFGPENGSIPKALLHLCHRFVVIPSHHCLNLAAAINVIGYDRRLKRIGAGKEADRADWLNEPRGWETKAT
jgi:tRNA(Leu) C34 or U34 (ribose-2'-O)-methylase TrmL